jgi:16S rRNA C1402 N4-methylase RsmH
LTTGQLKDAITKVFPSSAKTEKDAVIKRAFQALRIAVNQELLNLQTFLEDCPNKFMDT